MLRFWFLVPGVLVSDAGFLSLGSEIPAPGAEISSPGAGFPAPGPGGVVPSFEIPASGVEAPVPCVGSSP